MSENPHFPFFYGMIKSRSLLIECIDNSTTLPKSLEKKCFILKWESICSDIVRAVYSLHLKGILHNDLHCNNVLLSGDCHAKIIDFGKCTLIEDLIIYAIKPDSEKQKPYNKYHCHFAYEVRHIPGSKVSCKTDIY